MHGSLFQKIIAHKFYVSFAFSDTGMVRGAHVRLLFVLMFVFLIVGGSGYSFYNYENAIERRIEISGIIPQEAQDKIATLSDDRENQEKQIRLFAEELGILQARLDRFDAISEKLFNDPSIGAHLDAPDLAGKGGVNAPELLSTPSWKEMTSQLVALQDKTDGIDSMMNAGMKLLSTQEVAKSQKPYLWPVKDVRSYITSSFGYRSDPFKKSRRFHGGVDFAAGLNAKIVAAGDGVVVFAGYRYNFGNTVEIRHAHGFTTRYAHMNSVSTKNGEQVKAGDLIGRMGSTGRSTGNHLHFETLIGDTKVNGYPFIRETKDEVHALAREENAANIASVK